MHQKAPKLLGLLQDAAFQLSRLTGPNLEVYSRTFAVLAGIAARVACGEDEAEVIKDFATGTYSTEDNGLNSVPPKSI